MAQVRCLWYRSVACGTGPLLVAQVRCLWHRSVDCGTGPLIVALWVAGAGKL